MTRVEDDDRMAAVTLIFPPMVELSFGAYYPSTAVLAAWLEQHHVRTTQIDLNNRFADYVLSDEIVTRLADAAYPGLTPSELPSTFARWSSRERHRLLAPDGRKLFHAGHLGYVVAELARPFLVDPGPEAIEALDDGALAHPLDTHVDFLHWSGVSEQIPATTRLIGISVPMGPQLVPALLLARHLKQARSDLRIVAGGPALSLMDADDIAVLLVNHRSVDAVVRFDGEFPLLELAEQVLAGSWEPLRVPGVSAVNDPVRIHGPADVTHVPPRAGPILSSLPLPMYAPSLLAQLTDPVLSVTQARGCYWGKCDYCDFVELYDGSPPYRGRRPDDVFRDMAELSLRHGMRRFTLITESIPPAFARKLSERLIAAGLGLRWESFAMVDRRFDNGLLRLMADAGCELLVVGLETMSTRVLKLVHKSADREENLRFLREAGEAGLHVSINVIPDLPSTTLADAEASLRDLESVASYVHSVSIFPFEATRSSRVGREPEAFGLVKATDPAAAGQAQYRLNHLGNVDPAMDPETRAAVHRRFAEFARRVNRRAVLAPDGRAEAVGRYRIPFEDFDVLDQGTDTVTLTNVVAKDRVRMSRKATDLLEPFLHGSPFTHEDLVHVAGKDTADSLLRNLTDLGLLTLVPSGDPA